MIRRDTLSYAFSHHLFHQAEQLRHRLANYQAVTPSYFSAATVARAGRYSAALQKILARRSHPSLPASTVRTYPVEHLYQIGARLARQHYSYFSAHDRMARRILRDFAPPRTLIAIDTGAETLFKAWRGRSRLVLDLTIATAPYREKIFSDAEASPLHHGIRFHHPGPWELTRYAAEVALADLILCPSEFVMDSCRFMGAPETKLRLLPYGFDPGLFTPGERPPDERFKIVFAGTFCHRKGSHLLLEAFASFHRRHAEAELHVFGDVLDAPANAPEGVTFHGRVPQTVLAHRMREMDVMAFPTLFEGSAYVVYQALASGVPVITTRNCGSVVDESCGIILPEISAPALLAALENCHANRPRLAAMSDAAPRAVSRHTWSHYGDHLAEILASGSP